MAGGGAIRPGGGVILSKARPPHKIQLELVLVLPPSIVYGYAVQVRIPFFASGSTRSASRPQYDWT